MRTSRVNPMTSSAFRNQRPMIHDATYQSGDEQRKRDSQPRPFSETLLNNKKVKRKENDKQGVQLKSASSFVGYENHDCVHLESDLNETAKMLRELSKQKKRIQTYRSSI